MMSELSDIAKQGLMQPQEAMLEIKSRKNSLHIGIPKGKPDSPYPTFGGIISA
jgi:hypothetical protein